MKFGTKKVIYIGLFVAISIVLTRMFSFYPLPTIRISFGDVPIMLSGIFFGPLAGAVTGALADLTGVVMFPAPTGATFFPGFTLSKILVGLIPALLYRNLKGHNLVKLAISVVVTEIVCSLTLDTIWLSMMYNKGILILLPTRLVSRSIITVIEIMLIHIIVTRVEKASVLSNA